MDSILIAVNKAQVPYMEPAFDGLSYEREYIKDLVYYSFDEIEWHPGFITQVDDIIERLHEIGHENYAFVRFGDELEDSELHGAIKDFNITIIREVKYS